MEKTTNAPLWAKFTYALAALAAIAAFVPAKAQSSASPTVTVVATDNIAREGTTDHAVLTFTRSGSTTAPLTVHYALSGTAGKWTDYRTDKGSIPTDVVIPAGASSVTVTIVAVADTITEGQETAIFTLAPNSAYNIGAPSAAIIAINDANVNTPPPALPNTGTTTPPPSGGSTTPTQPPATTPTLSVVATKNVATKDGQAATLTFARTGSTASAVTVPFVLSGTATKWTDYRNDEGSMPTSIVIPAGASSKTMNIIVSPTATFSGSRTAIFTLSTVGGYTLGSENAAIIAINSAGITTPPPALPGNTGGGTTTPSPTPEPTPTPSPTGPNSVSVVATDNIAREGTNDHAVLTFTRTGSTASAITVNYALSGTAGKWTDYRTDQGSIPTSIVIPAGAASATMTIVAVADTINEIQETAIFTITSGTGYSVGTPNAAIIAINDANVNTPPPALPGSGGTTTPPPSTGGDTTPPAPTTPTLTISASTANIVEGGAGSTLTFTRTGSTTAAVTVPYVLSGTATKWTDYRNDKGSIPTSIVIPAGATSVTQTIIALADTEKEGTETAIFTLGAVSGYTLGSPSSVTLSINDVGSNVPAPTPTPTPTPDPSPTNPPSTSPVEVVDYTTLEMPKPGDHALKILAPNVVELRLINTKEQNAAPTLWNFVANNKFNAPAASQFNVTVNGQSVSVAEIGFRRRPLYVPLQVRDLRIDNSLILRLNSTIPANATVEVKNPGNALWPSSMSFKAVNQALRESGAIHVNQEGYAPNLPKKAMVGYYLGSMGELDIPASAGFQIVEAATGKAVFNGSLVSRKETGYTYTPAPYQKVMEADFSSFTTPGEYRLVVPGFGASLPFLINDGVPMAFLRTYALGLYHQRCGHPNHLPFTRHTHDACHTAPAAIIPDNSPSWGFIAAESAKTNPSQTARQLKDKASMLYPFVNQGPIDVSGGHHDAGDYSKYTSNSALLVSSLIFAVDSMPGVAQLDNLGLPESGDGIADILQMAKIEADFLAKMQDADGGFYFLVYPANRKYESNVLPDKGDAQIVWPKTTSVTAAGVAALAQMASSPKFKAAYPQDAARYLTKAKLGWQFLMNAIAKHGKTGAYQKITHYGDNFMHDDELAWAAVEMYLATGEAQYRTKIHEWFPNPLDSSTFRWGWWRMYESYGNAVRSYAFANRSGRNVQLDATYLSRCEQVIIAAGDETVRWAKAGAYPTSFPDNTKRMRTSGWFFSLDHAMDIAVAHVISPKNDYIDALVGNMNYEGGTNPVNVSFITGLGTKRQREIVHQYTQNDRRVLPMTGIPQGNVVASFAYLDKYGAELGQTVFPSDDNNATPTYPFYDRWADAYNVTTEFVHVNQARSLVALTVLANMTQAKNTAWKSANLSIVAPTSTVQVGSLVELKLSSSLNLNGARIVWEAREQEPAYGNTYVIQPKSTGEQWVEAEVQWPDGRRAFAHGKFMADANVVKFVDDEVPAGAKTTVGGGDSWNWVSSSPTPYSGKFAHKTNAGSTGIREHGFTGANSPMEIGVGDTLFAYVYLEAGSAPSTIMLHWFDGSSWDHRAYWGANNISYGTNGTAGRYNAGALPATGRWVRLEVPAKAVGLEGKKVYGMCFSTFGGGATWDVTGRAKPGATLP